MSLSPVFLHILRRRCRAGFAFLVLVGLPLLADAQVETGQWKTKAKGPFGQLTVFFPTPTTDTGNPELLVIPLLGPERHLLPGGKLLVWVGRNDGTPLANASVTIRVPAGGNTLADSGSRVTEVTLQTNADGIATAFLTAPDIPRGSANGGDGDDGGGGPTPE